MAGAFFGFHWELLPLALRRFYLKTNCAVTYFCSLIAISLSSIFDRASENLVPINL
jgi:hypothetical protein